MDEVSASPEQRRLLLSMAALGLAAIIALPLSVTEARRLAPILVFATPVLLVLHGRLQDRPWEVRVGAGLLLALLVLVLLPPMGVDPGPVAILAPAVLLAGPVVAVVTVGLPLREVDLAAGGAFLISATIAVISGFAAAGTTGASGLILGVALVGFTAVAFRLGKVEDSSR